MTKALQTAEVMLAELRKAINALPSAQDRHNLLRALTNTQGVLATRFDKWARDLQTAQASVASHKNYASTLEAQMALLVESNPLSVQETVECS